MKLRHPAHPPSDETVRAQRHDAWRARLRHALDAHDVDVATWAREAGISESVALRCVSRTGGNHAALADVETLPPLVRREIVSALAETCGCTLAELADPVDPGTDLALWAQTAADSAHALEAFATSMRDGAFDAIEGAHLEAVCTRAMQAFAAMREIARTAQRERVVGVRVVPMRRGGA